MDKSGTCAIVLLIVDDLVFIANVGDSRAVLSRNQGTTIHDLSVDHKPGTKNEFHRIKANGGKVY